MQQLIIKTRQSELNTWQDCPNVTRLLRTGEATDDRYSTDLVRGNIMHEIAETCGEAMLAGQGALSLADSLDLAEMSFDVHAEKVVWWRDSPEKTLGLVRKNITAWHNQVLPTLSPVSIEESFKETVFESDELKVVLTGTADWIEKDRIIDWKNPGALPSKAFPRKDWKLRRNDFQSHAYTWAFDISTFVWFHFTNGEIEEITVDRGPVDWDAFLFVCESFGKWVQAGMPAVPRWDTWRCSPTWCCAWDQCRGKQLGDDPWNNRKDRPKKKRSKK